MKLFHIIFGIYILFLCSMPCTDVCTSDSGNLAKSEISSQPVNPHENETCSPFCNCFCCGSIAIVISMLPKIVSTEFNSTKIFQPEISKVKNLSFSVWQPPKTA
ncbi:MAG TPA: DUF6660 family protein [Bacteroidia bacterium]|nr:DUF6660 family protein [Bacteroidia bacterium]